MAWNVCIYAEIPCTKYRYDNKPRRSVAAVASRCVFVSVLVRHFCIVNDQTSKDNNELQSKQALTSEHVIIEECLRVKIQFRVGKKIIRELRGRISSDRVYVSSLLNRRRNKLDVLSVQLP